jgi:SHS family lactate transporter-like MFS transporter
MSNLPAPSLISPKDRNRAVLAGFLGWTLDAFDFFLVVMTASTIAKDLGVDRADIFLANWATLAARPLGAIIFGLLADRYGRRTPLMLNLVFYSIIEFATGFSPNFATFIALRFLFGIGMGGEWGVGASLMMEKISPKFRGLLSGLLQEGYSFGYLLAALVYGLLYPHFATWFPHFASWRILFFLGGVPALLAVFVRYGIKESEVWKASRSENWSQLFAVIAKHWKLLLFLIVLMAAFNSSSHGTQDLYPTFLEKDRNLSEFTRGAVTAISQVGAIIGGILFGAWSDKIGRRRAIIIAFIGALACVPLWAFAPFGNLPLLALGGFLMQFMVQGAWGIVPAHLAELAPDAVRGFLPGFGYQCGALISGAVPFIQESLQHHGRPKVMAITCATVFTLAIIIVALGKEQKGIHFGQHH